LEYANLRVVSMKSLIHNGVLVTSYEPKGYRIRFRGKEMSLGRRRWPWRG
jgi:hypothetical protein